MSSLQRDVLKSKLPPLPDRVKTGSRFSGLVPKRNKKDFTPTEWNEYFDKKEDVTVGENTFRVYVSGSTGPIVLALHGGGHSALSWAVFSKHISSMCECTVVAIDFRGHGQTKTVNDSDMSANVLAQDIADVMLAYFQDLPPVVLLGHSMGGAIAVHIAVKQLIPTLKGLAVIDVVEGTALESLSSMQSFIRSRPAHFKSVEYAIEWSIRAGQLKNLDSAKISMPGQLKKVSKTKMIPLTESTMIPGMSNISEEDPIGASSAERSSDDSIYTWNVDLSKTEPYWRGWFENMSSLFLSSPVAKLLILAGVDRLDKEMTIAQMQGKFQMQILANCGHMVHEDVPDKVAEILAGFLIRQRLTEQKETFYRQMPAC